MLAENSERQKVMLVLKKDNKKMLEFMAKRDNRNLSRQVDFLIEKYRDQCELQIIELLEDSDLRLSNGEKCMSGDELRAKLGV